MLNNKQKFPISIWELIKPRRWSQFFRNILIKINHWTQFEKEDKNIRFDPFQFIHAFFMHIGPFM